MEAQVRSLPNVKKKQSGNRIGIKTGTVMTYLSPALMGILLVNIIPIIYSFYISLTNRNGPAHFAEGNYHVTGFQNYIRLLSEPDFYVILGKTLLYTVVCVPLFFIVGLTFAIILNNSAIKIRTFWRTLMILPWAVPYWITALIWKFLFHSEFGPINQIFENIRIVSTWLVTAWYLGLYCHRDHQHLAQFSILHVDSARRLTIHP